MKSPSEYYYAAKKEIVSKISRATYDAALRSLALSVSLIPLPPQIWLGNASPDANLDPAIFHPSILLHGLEKLIYHFDVSYNHNISSFYHFITYLLNPSPADCDTSLTSRLFYARCYVLTMIEWLENVEKTADRVFGRDGLIRWCMIEISVPGAFVATSMEVRAVSGQQWRPCTAIN